MCPHAGADTPCAGWLGVTEVAMESEEDAQTRIDNWHLEQQKRKTDKLYAAYMERVRVYAEARAQGKTPVDFQPNPR